ncbi:MAG TPA: hypothetical protein VFX02_09040 [Gammaproteobacteria bacterium]|nr:hypothetical protein [Gammaproteobacteria bacterium]
MLQALIERLLRPVHNPGERTGVLLDRGGAWIAGVAAAEGELRLALNRRVPFKRNPFSEEAGREAIVAAGTALAEFLRSADAGRYNPVRIALPDPAVNLAVFELDAMPKTRRERDELARWLFKKELYLDADNLACVARDLGADGGRKLLLAAAVAGAWTDGIGHALRGFGIFPAALGVSAISVFNALPGGGGRNGALLSFENDFWSLLLWDEAMRPRLLRGYWREQADAVTDPELRGIVSEAERLITSYVRAGSGRRIEKIYVAGGAPSARRFVGLLNERLSEEAAYVDFSGRCRDPAAGIPACCYALCGEA